MVGLSFSDVASAPASARSRRLLFWAGAMLAAFPVVLLLTVFARKTVNIPVSDDFFSLLPFLSDWQEHTSFSERWHLLIAQYYGHRIVFTRLVTLADFYLFGECNLIALQVVGWLGWIAVAVGLVGTLPTFRQSPWLALPVALLLMHVEGYTNLLFAIGMGNLWVIAFALGAAWCAFCPLRGRLILSLAFALLASLSFVNGLLAFPAVLIGLLLRRDIRSALAVAGFGAATWIAYLASYINPLPPVAPAEILRKAAIMAGGFVTLGRIPDQVSLYAGSIVLLSAAILLCNRRLWREQPAHGSFLVFLVFSIFTAARGRSGWDDYYMLQDRYRLYGLLVLATAYVISIELFARSRKIVGIGGSIIAAPYCLLAYATFYAPLCATQAWCKSTALNRPLGECVANSLPNAWPECARILERAEHLGVYRLPELLSAEDLALIRGLPPVAQDAHACDLEPNGACAGFSVIPPLSSQSTAGLAKPPDFGVLVLSDRRVILGVDRFRVRFAELLSHPSFLSGRYGLILPRSNYTSPGRRAVYGLRRNEGGHLAVLWSGVVDFP